MRLVEWPRMPYLTEEVREWIGLELKNLGVEDLAVYAMEAGVDDDAASTCARTPSVSVRTSTAPAGR